MYRRCILCMLLFLWTDGPMFFSTYIQEGQHGHSHERTTRLYQTTASHGTTSHVTTVWTATQSTVSQLRVGQAHSTGSQLRVGPAGHHMPTYATKPPTAGPPVTQQPSEPPVTTQYRTPPISQQQSQLPGTQTSGGQVVCLDRQSRHSPATASHETDTQGPIRSQATTVLTASHATTVLTASHATNVLTASHATVLQPPVTRPTPKGLHAVSQQLS